MAEQLGILVVDDSALSRETLRRVLELDKHLKVVGEATTGEEAIALVKKLRPSLITMDLQMPGMGGLNAIEVIMRERPTAIVVISERSSSTGLDLNAEAIGRGALELVPKSAVFGSSDDAARRFAARIRLLASSGREEEWIPPPQPAPTIPVTKALPDLLGIGASTGGPRAVAKVLSALPREFPLPIVVVQHMAEDFFDSFVRFLGDASGRAVTTARAGQTLEAGHVTVAPPRQELFVKEDMSVRLLPPPPGQLISPSVDSLFFSMASALKDRGLGVLLSGMGEDGAQGLLRMRRMGARTVAQDKATCAVYGMPRAAVELGAVESVLPLDRIGPWVAEVVGTAKRRLPAAGDARRRVLVMDDDAETRDAARRALEAAGFTVETLDNPLILARVLRTSKAELVLLESELSTMSGAAAIQTMRSYGLASVPVLLYSRLEEKALRSRVAECGALGYVRKGSPDQLLVQEVTAFLGPPKRR